MNTLFYVLQKKELKMPFFDIFNGQASFETRVSVRVRVFWLSRLSVLDVFAKRCLTILSFPETLACEREDILALF